MGQIILDSLGFGSDGELLRWNALLNPAWQDSALSIAAAAGLKVNGITDASQASWGTPNNNHGTHTTSGCGAVWSTNGLNGKYPGLVFSGTTSGLITPSFFPTNTTGVSIYIVAQGGNFGTSASNTAIASDGGNAWSVYQNPSNNTYNIAQPGIGNSTLFGGVTASLPATNQAFVFCYRFLDGKYASFDFMTNGWRRDQLAGVYGNHWISHPGQLQLSGGMFLGGLSGAGWNWNGIISAIEVVGRGVDESEHRRKMEAYAGAFEIGNGPIVFCDGDSDTSGNGATGGNNGTSFPEILRVDAAGAYMVQCYAYAGRIMGEACREDYHGLFWQSFPLVNQQQACVCWYGQNDLNQYTVSQVWAFYVDRVQRLLQAGIYGIIAVTPLPRDCGNPTATAAYEVARAAFASTMRANYQAIGCAALWDNAADLLMGQTGQNTDSEYYQGDNIHPNATGNAHLAGTLAPLVPIALARAAAVLITTLPSSTGNVSISETYGNGLEGTAVLTSADVQAIVGNLATSGQANAIISSLANGVKLDPTNSAGSSMDAPGSISFMLYVLDQSLRDNGFNVGFIAGRQLGAGAVLNPGTAGILNANIVDMAGSPSGLAALSNFIANRIINSGTNATFDTQTFVNSPGGATYQETINETVG